MASSGPKAPAAPDYSGIAKASETQAKNSYALSQEQLDWAKQQYSDNKEITDKVIGSAVRRQALNDQNATTDRARYEQIYQPLEDKAAADARDYSSEDRKQLEMGKAQATVAQNFQGARDAAVKNLEGYGVDPSSTRFAALDANSRIQQAAASAGAGNQARAQTDAMGRALTSEAINVGRGYPGQVAGAYGTALQSGNSAGNTTLAQTASGASTMGTATDWANMGNGSLGTATNALTQGYNAQLNQFNANQNASSGIGSFVGAGVGLLAAPATGGGSIFSSMLGFAEGGAIPTGDVPNGGTPGGGIPAAASPSNGSAVDDVDAKLTAGEFVIPKDVAAWYGEQHFQKLIQKAREAQPQAQAQPKYAVGRAGPPTFVSRPGMTSAIPGR